MARVAVAALYGAWQYIAHLVQYRVSCDDNDHDWYGIGPQASINNN